MSTATDHDPDLLRAARTAGLPDAVLRPRYQVPRGGTPRWLRRAFLPLSTTLIVAALVLVPLPQVPGRACCSAFLETPGAALPLASSVLVDDAGAGFVDGDYLVMTVRLEPATALGWLRAQVSRGATLQARQGLVSAEVSDRDYFQRQRTVFDTSTAVAAAVGLGQAGFGVDADALIGDGALISRVVDDSAAQAARLRPGDVITAVDGVDIGVAEELWPLISDGEPDRVLSVRRGSQQLEVPVAISPLPIDGGQVVGLGIEAQTANPRIALPVPVQVDAGSIGGPSAGLLIALTVFDTIDDIDLAAGRRIAGTGTMAPDGTVGTIGGIQQKVLAAHRESADVFLAPEAQAERAREAVPPSSELQVIAVGTFADAVAALAAPLDDTQG